MITKKEWELIAKMISFSVATAYFLPKGLDDSKVEESLRKTMLEMKHIKDAPSIDKV